MNMIQLKADCNICAADNGSPTVTIKAYAGGIMSVSGFGPIVIDLEGMALASVPLLADHDNRLAGIAGYGSAEVRGGELHVAGKLASGTSAADQILALHRSGVQLQASVGATAVDQVFIAAGRSIKANGRTIVAPKNGFQLIQSSILREVSFVAAGADPETSVAIAAQRNKTMQGFNDFVSTMLPDSDPADMTAGQLATLHANYQGRDTATAADHTAVAPMILASADPVQAEERRLRQIEAAANGDWGDKTEAVVALKARAIGGELSVGDLLSKLRLIRSEISMSTLTVPPSMSHNHRAAEASVIEASFCLQANLPDIEERYNERVLEAADKIRRMGLQELLLRAAIAGGYSCHPGERVNDGNLKKILAYAFPDVRASGGFSTFSVPGILSNVANKFLVDGFTEGAGDEWRKISQVKPLDDFKPASFYRMLDNLEYEELGADGEIKHGTLGERDYGVQADTYARMLSITRKDIINDDLGAFTDVPQRLGRAAGMKFRRVFWSKFLANTSFFDDATNGNEVAGAGTALTVTGEALEAALTYFRAQRSPAADGSKLIGGRPAVMMVPPALELTARRLLNSSTIVAGSLTETMPSANPFFQLAELLVVDWLADASLGGSYSDSLWYLFRAASQAPAMLVGFLNGNESPTVNTADADFNVLGIQMRGYHDFGCSLAETLCGVQVAGEPEGT